MNKIQNKTNWNNYINFWLLLKTHDNKWFFGKLIEYDSDKGKMKLLALVDRKFYYIEMYINNIIEAWVVDKWTQFRHGSRNSKTLAFVSNSKDNNVSVIDTKTRKIDGKPIPDIDEPYGLATTPDGRYLYIVSHVIKNAPITIIDLKTMNVVDKPISVGSYPKEITISPDGKYAYVSNWQDDTVSVIDTTLKKVIATINVGSCPLGIAFTPDSKFAYVVNHWTTHMSIIDTTSKKTIARTVYTGSGAGGVVIEPNGKFAFVTTGSSNKVIAINLDNNNIETEIVVGKIPSWIAITPNGKFAYVTNSKSNSVSVIDVAKQTIVGEQISVGTKPERIAITPDGLYAFVTNSKDNTVSVINLITNKVVGSPIPVGDSPLGIAIAKLENGEPDEFAWNDLVSKWLLLRYSNYEWVFGKLIDYDSSKNQLSLLALVEDKFRYTKESSNNIIELWRADKWTNLTTRSIEEPLLDN